MANFFKKSNDEDINEADMQKILNDASTVSLGSGKNYNYVVLQVTLTKKGRF